MSTNFSRRSWLFGSACTAMTGVGLGATLRPRAALAQVGSPKNLIVVNAVGGWDTTYTIDPKEGVSNIDAPTDGEIRSFGGIEVLDAPTRPSVAGFFDDFADITTVVNGLQTSSISHTEGYRRIMTGSSSRDAPDFGTITAVEHGIDRAAPYLVLGTVSFSGPYASAVTRTGNLNQLGTLLDANAGFPLEDGTFGYQRFAPNEAEDALIREHLRARASAGRTRWGDLGRNGRRGADFEAAIERAELLEEIGGLSDVDYAQSFGTQIDLAVEALSNGMSRACEIELSGWDTHTGNVAQGALWERLFRELHRLVSQLDSASLLEDTVIAVVSEMGRTPLLNGNAGKDHWPVTSAMLIGTDLGGGRTLGGTNDQFDARNVDLETGEIDADGSPLRHGNFAAGLLEQVGVDPVGYLGTIAPLRGL